MSILSDLETALGVEAYATQQANLDGSVEMSIVLLTAPITNFTDVENVIPGSPTYSEAAIALLNDRVASLYGYENFGVDNENVLIYLIETPDHKWAHVFQYASNGDYLLGKDAQVPAQDLRV